MKADHVSIVLSRRQVEVVLEAIALTNREKTGALRHAERKLREALKTEPKED